MTDVPQTKADTAVAKPAVAKQSGKKTEVTEAVVIETNALDVSQPMRIEHARDVFLATIKETYGDGPLEDVRFIKVNHHVGKSATYYFSATIGG